MEDINYNRTQEEEKALYDTLTKRITNLERVNYKKKKYNGPEMQKRIKKIIEEEVAKA